VLNFELGRTLVILGVIIVLAGIVIMVIGKVPFIGKFPGDIHIQKENFSFYFPITTSILVSVILSVIFWLFSKR